MQRTIVSLSWKSCENGESMSSTCGKRRPLSALRRALCLFFLVAIGACGTVDQFSRQAVDYNLEIEKVQDEGLLLNILRAAYRQPLQFVDVTTVTGTATATLSGSLAAPFASFGGPATGLYNLNPGASVSGGPSFNMAVLNTQEFYRGIVNPIPLQMVKLYLEEGVPRSVLFSLLVSELQYTEEGAEPRTFANTFERIGNAESMGYQAFSAVLDALISHGLSIEEVAEDIPVGQVLSDADVRGFAVAKDADAQGLKIVEYNAAVCNTQLPPCEGGFAGLSADELEALRKNGRFFRVEKQSVIYRLCFDTQEGAAAWTGENEVATRIARSAVGEGSVCGYKKRAAGAFFGTTHFSFGANRTNGFDISLKTRSVEGVISYLGEIARFELNLGDDGVPISSGSNRPGAEVTIDGHSTKVPLFSIAGVPGAHKTLAVSYLGNEFYVPVSPTGDDRSGQVLQILGGLMALNKAAKDLPAPTIVPLISR